MMDEQQQPTTEVTQAVADSNAATGASLSTSVSTSQEVGGADAGEPNSPDSSSGTATSSQALLVPLQESASLPTSLTTDAPAVAQPGEIASGAPAASAVAASTQSGESASASPDGSRVEVAADATLADVGEHAALSVDSPINVPANRTVSGADVVFVEHSRVMSALIRAKNHLEALEAGMVRNAYAAIEEIEAIFREAKGG